MNCRRIISIGLLAISIAAYSTGSSAADPPKQAEPRPAEFLLIPLKHADASKIAPIIQQLANISAIAIPQTNSIGISADKGRFAEIRGIIEQLDVAPRKAASQDQLRTYSLKSIVPDKSFEQALGLILSGRQNARYAIDPARSQVIVSCDEQTADLVTALISRLDTPPEPKSNSDMQVRIIWLINGGTADKSSKMPEDIGAVLPTLARMGIDKPALAAQAVVSTAPDTSFVAKGAAILDNTAHCDLSISGMAREDKNGSRLSLNIQAVQGKQEICRLETEIAAPLGHIVVLGMTPTSSLTSVFLVQLRRVEPVDGKK